jgi:thiol:disulfide interchange protein
MPSLSGRLMIVVAMLAWPLALVHGQSPPEPATTTKTVPTDTSKWSTKWPIYGKQEAVEITVKLEPTTIKPGEKAKLSVTLVPKGGYHLFEESLDGNSKTEDGKPILLHVAKTPGLTVGKIEPSIASHLDLKNNPVYEEPVTLTIDLMVAKDFTAKEIMIQGGIGVQLCAENCLLPEGFEFSGKLNVSDTAVPGQEIRWNKVGYTKIRDWIQGKGEPGITVIKSTTPEQTTTVPNTNTTPSTNVIAESTALPVWELQTVGGEVRSVMTAMVFGIIGGFILNFMPCVLPVIGLKILSFVQQAGHQRRQILMLNLVYVAGIMVVFLALAGLLIMFQVGWGKQFQSTWFNVVMISVVFAMALSFLGVWEIPIPGLATSKSLNEVATHKGYGGAFAKGILTTLLATPCSGPFLGAVFSYAAGQPWQVVLAVFGSIGLGMSLPYLLIGAFPGLIKLLPKPGAWMETFKHIMGFVLLGTVVFLFMNLNEKYFIPMLAMLFAIWFMLWWLGRVPIYESFDKKLRAILVGGTVAFAVSSLSFTYLGGGKSESELDWIPYSHAELLKQTRQGKTVILDLTANWCQTCKVNLAVAINRAAVKSVVKQNDVIAIKADLTEEHPETNELLKNLNSDSIPILAIFPAKSPNRPIVLRDLVTQQEVLNALEEAGPSLAPQTATKTEAKP